MARRRQRFVTIFGQEIDLICDERSQIPGYRKALTDAIYQVLDKEKMRLDYENTLVSLQHELREIVYKLGDYIGEN